jgi:hypothetical protein
MPMEIITDNPGTIALPVAGFGILLKLAIHFWYTDCRDLPTSADRLYVISCAHRPTWNNHRPEIELILKDIMPKMKAAWIDRQRRIESLTELRSRGHAAYKLRKLGSANAAPAAIAAPARPVRDQTWRAAKANPAPATEPVRRQGFVEKVR